MNSITKLTYILAGIWIAVKLYLYYSGNAIEHFSTGVTLNFAFILFIIYNALMYFYRTEEGRNSDFMIDIKIALKASLKYMIIIFGFLVVYYLVIHKTFPEERAVVQLELVKENVEKEGGYDVFIEKYKEEIESFKSTSEDPEQIPQNAEEYYRMVKGNFTEMMRPSILLPAMILGLFFMCLALSAIGAGIFKRIMPKQIRNLQ